MHVSYQQTVPQMHKIDRRSHKESKASISKEYQKTLMKQGAFDMDFSFRM